MLDSLNISLFLKRRRSKLDHGTTIEKGLAMGDVPEIIEDSLIHEHAHVIAEWGKKRDPEIVRLVHASFGDEETFAEKFVKHVTRVQRRPFSPHHETVLRRDDAIDIDFHRMAIPVTSSTRN
jgi:hypothetical protein